MLFSVFSGDEETQIGKKIGEEEIRQDDRVIWDGHSASMEAATRAARANISFEEQIQEIHKAKGLLADEDKEKIGPKATPGGAQAPAAAPAPGPAPAPPVAQKAPPPMQMQRPPMQPNPTPVRFLLHFFMYSLIKKYHFKENRGD